MSILEKSKVNKGGDAIDDMTEKLGEGSQETNVCPHEHERNKDNSPERGDTVIPCKGLEQ